MKYYSRKICNILKGLGTIFLLMCVLSICWCRPMNEYYAKSENQNLETVQYNEQQYTILESWKDNSKECIIAYNNTTGIKYFIEKDLNSENINPSYKPLYNEDGSLQVYKKLNNQGLNKEE